MIEPEEFGKVGDRVYVTLFHKEDVVVLEDRAGNRYVKSVPMKSWKSSWTKSVAWPLHLIFWERIRKKRALFRCQSLHCP